MFYICIIVYLYGDLAIYAAAVPMSLMEVAWWGSANFLHPLPNATAYLCNSDSVSLGVYGSSRLTFIVWLPEFLFIFFTAYKSIAQNPINKILA